MWCRSCLPTAVYEVGVGGKFQATHRLRGDFGPATHSHGHAYQVEVVAAGPSLGTDGTLVDVDLLQRILNQAVSALHGRDLDTLPVFRGENTTAEVVAHHLYAAMRSGLESTASPGADRVASLRVTVWESPEVFGRFEGPAAEPGRG